MLNRLRVRAFLLGVPFVALGIFFGCSSSDSSSPQAVDAGQDTNVPDGPIYEPDTAACVVGSAQCPASSCLQIKQVTGGGDGAYYVDTTDGTGGHHLYCDMTVDDGGWTLVGQVDGIYDMSATWLRMPFNETNLATTAIEPGTYACVDAVLMAVHNAKEVRLSDGTITKWVKWNLPSGKAAETFWNHAAGQATIAASALAAVTVTASDGTTGACMQNPFGVNPSATSGGGYPFTVSAADGGAPQSGDLCMSVLGIIAGVDGYAAPPDDAKDAPSGSADWPNASTTANPSLSVWLR